MYNQYIHRFAQNLKLLVIMSVGYYNLNNNRYLYGKNKNIKHLGTN